MSYKALKDFSYNQELDIFIHPEKVLTNYRDGAEDYVLSVLKEAQDTTAYSPALSKFIKDWPSRYHLSIKRINLMESIKELLDKNSKVLEIGCGTGPITRWLGENFAEVDAIEGEPSRAKAARYRTRDLKNVRVYCGDVLSTEFGKEHYGLIIVTGVLEYIPFYDLHNNDPKSSSINFLRNIQKSLHDNGTLLLAIENKFGVKYFTGCKEDHTNREFDGLIDYPNKSPVTFSRNELEEILISSGFENSQFYHLFPDYKLLETIIKEDDEALSLSPYNWIGTPFEDYSGQRLHIFPELLFLKSITKAKLLWHFSNSFLVLAGKSNNLNLKTDWLIKKFYTREPYKPVFHHTVTVRRDPAKGHIVKRKPIFLGKSEYNGKNLVYELEKENRFVYGDSLKIDVNRAIMSHNYKKELADIMKRINDILMKEFWTGEVDDEGYPLLNGEAVDYTFFNIIKSEDGNYNFIDRKWKFKDNIPSDFVLYRNLYQIEFFFAPFLPVNDPFKFVEFMKEIYPNYNKERLSKKNVCLEELFQSEVRADQSLTYTDSNIADYSLLNETKQKPGKLAIPNTILCCIDCINHDLSVRAIEHCLKICRFDRALFFTDRECHPDGIEVIKIPIINTKEQYSRFVIKELNQYINADYVLMIQYDGFIINPEAWTFEFQKYDYIGARWEWYADGFNVGNGGFSLRSKRLLQALSEEAISIDSMEHGEDTLICRTYRSFLEDHYGIKFAPEHIADRFSYERSEPRGKPFGFHGLYNMWRHITPDYLKDFVNALSPQTLKSTEALELGMNYHKSGQLKEAEIVYKKILEVKPDHKEALAMLKIVQTVDKTGRNEPCHCGSGRKYKKCCGA